jgi:hypothetical protein
MGNAIVVNIHLDHEVLDQREGATNKEMKSFVPILELCLKSFSFVCVCACVCVCVYVAVEAGESLTGKVVVEVEETIDARNLNLELNGREISCIEDGKPMS